MYPHSVAAVPAAAPFTDDDRAALVRQYQAVRDRTEALAAPLSAEDQTVQSMPDASPTKWHRAHTSWFFETFVLSPHLPGYTLFDPAFSYVFNSYYEAAGPRHPRPARGLLTRPGVGAIAAYRAHVDRAMTSLLSTCGQQVADLVVLGLNHEQQHQELLLTDIKHAFSLSPLFPVYVPRADPATQGSAERELAAPTGWWKIIGGIHRIGHQPHLDGGFHFDNEGPAHDALIPDFLLADRPVTNGEYLAFMADGGYRRPEFWLSDGWAAVQAQGWEAPAYWHRSDEGWQVYTLHGLEPVNTFEPVSHISFYEAAAYALWVGARLPTEFEWERAARLQASEADRASDPRDDTHPHPRPVSAGLRQDIWEWTASPYSPYPGYRPPTGALGEYNGKFMVNQMVLRGRSCATPAGHDRLSYRNFFPAHVRWQFTGLRLAQDA
ncbi:ergothioneine biosynthesis protein EgtB [Nitrospirillum amazonense]|uniref:Ergothioneine biosynthesis protein EgtB n=1 Tax=Nitrospirillum amazonense TaxID=28077 RepID=A0A560ETV0_9PROT|nr:ergothioneine biosynthesis protein EgtB [Nitrospirillum amazonense]TWB12803.1 ergothioneine biosynthesis protein EgtB [Nitrospirillum amazonense]